MSTIVSYKKIKKLSCVIFALIACCVAIIIHYDKKRSELKINTEELINLIETKCMDVDDIQILIKENYAELDDRNIEIREIEKSIRSLTDSLKNMKIEDEKKDKVIKSLITLLKELNQEKHKQLNIYAENYNSLTKDSIEKKQNLDYIINQQIIYKDSLASLKDNFDILIGRIVPYDKNGEVVWQISKINSLCIHYSISGCIYDSSVINIVVESPEGIALLARKNKSYDSYYNDATWNIRVQKPIFRDSVFIPLSFSELGKYKIKFEGGNEPVSEQFWIK